MIPLDRDVADKFTARVQNVCVTSKFLNIASFKAQFEFLVEAATAYFQLILTSLSALCIIERFVSIALTKALLLNGLKRTSVTQKLELFRQIS